MLTAAPAARLVLNEQRLSHWLVLNAACVWLKKFLNRWFKLRSRKRQQDIFDDTDETVDPATLTSSGAEVSFKVTRKPAGEAGSKRDVRLMRQVPCFPVVILIYHPPRDSALAALW